MSTSITPDDLRSLLAGPAEVALLDVRDHGEYNTAHIPGATWLPRRRIEVHAQTILPYTGSIVVVYCDGGTRSALAAATLERMGFTGVRLLAGGTARWTTEGHPTEWGVNVPSKAFGEHIMVHDHPAEIDSDELHRWNEEGVRYALLDSRTPQEHASETLPGSRSIPNGELALRVPALDIDPATPIVVHCAGRTRSIMGAATLRRLGYDNVYAFKNGTMGWHLAGYELERGSDRTQMPPVPDDARADGERRGRAFAGSADVPFIAVDELDALLASGAERTVYAIDVRTHQEFVAGHIPGFQWFAGGQLVQRTDEALVVHNAQVVLACDGVARAATVAAWLREMGITTVAVLDGGTTAWTGAGRELVSGHETREPAGLAEARSQAPRLSPGEASASGRTVLHAGTSREFASGHVPGTRWTPRGWLERDIATLAPERSAPLLLTCPDGVQSAFAAATLRELGYADVAVLDGGMAAWREAGFDVETGLSGVMSPPQDVVLAGTDRTSAEMMHYLQWELTLTWPHPSLSR